MAKDDNFEFGIFRSKGRGLGTDPSNGVFMRIGVKFRKYLRYFKGAKLHVFMHIALHADENGDAFPDYERIKEDTDYGDDAISTAIKALCALEINGERVLIKWRERDANGRYTGGNRYKIFPTPAEIASMESGQMMLPDSEKPSLGKSKSGKNRVEEELSLTDKNNQPIADTIFQFKGVPLTGVVKGERKWWFSAICLMLGYDTRLIGTKDRLIVSGIIKKITDQPDKYTPDVMIGFAAWWETSFLGGKGIRPTSGNILSNLSKYYADEWEPTGGESLDDPDGRYSDGVDWSTVNFDQDDPDRY